MTNCSVLNSACHRLGPYHTRTGPSLRRIDQFSCRRSMFFFISDVFKRTWNRGFQTNKRPRCPNKQGTSVPKRARDSGVQKTKGSRCSNEQGAAVFKRTRDRGFQTNKDPRCPNDKGERCPNG